MSLAVRLVQAPVRFYRRFLSPLKPPTCRFHPTCSAYALEALAEHGVLRGSWLSVWRILRCHPFAKGGLDPVPPRHGRGEPGACNGGAGMDTLPPDPDERAP